MGRPWMECKLHRVSCAAFCKTNVTQKFIFPDRGRLESVLRSPRGLHDWTLILETRYGIK